MGSGCIGVRKPKVSAFVDITTYLTSALSEVVGTERTRQMVGEGKVVGCICHRRNLWILNIQIYGQRSAAARNECTDTVYRLHLKT